MKLKKKTVDRSCCEGLSSRIIACVNPLSIKTLDTATKTINNAIEKYNTQYGASVSSITVKANATNGSFDITSGQKDGKNCFLF